jgi:hypothetical protein
MQRSVEEPHDPDHRMVGLVGAWAVAAKMSSRFVFEKPWVIISFAGPEDDAAALGLLGAGALLPFARVAIDTSKKRLDLVPRADVARDGNGPARRSSAADDLDAG